MRVKLSGPVEFVEALEAAARSGEGAAIESPPTRRESTELHFGLKEAADLIVMAKNFAEFVSLCWTGVLVVRRLLQARGGAAAAAANAAPVSSGSTIPIEITTARGRIQLSIPLDITREGLAERLTPLAPGSTV